MPCTVLEKKHWEKKKGQNKKLREGEKGRPKKEQ